MTHFDIGNGTK